MTDPERLVIKGKIQVIDEMLDTYMSQDISLDRVMTDKHAELIKLLEDEDRSET